MLLRGKLHKKHQGKSVSEWGARYYEVDDHHSLLCCYHTRAALEKREPSRILLLSELESVRPLQPYVHAFRLTFSTGVAQGGCGGGCAPLSPPSLSPPTLLHRRPSRDPIASPMLARAS